MKTFTTYYYILQGGGEAKRNPDIQIFARIDFYHTHQKKKKAAVEGCFASTELVSAAINNHCNK